MSLPIRLQTLGAVQVITLDAPRHRHALARSHEQETLDASAAGVPLDDQSLAELLGLLQAHSTRAAERVEQLASPLLHRLGTAGLQRLLAALAGFDFGAAHLELATSGPPSAPGRIARWLRARSVVAGSGVFSALTAWSALMASAERSLLAAREPLGSMNKPPSSTCSRSKSPDRWREPRGLPEESRQRLRGCWDWSCHWPLGLEATLTIRLLRQRRQSRRRTAVPGHAASADAAVPQH
jgi:hypothetical protein